MTKVGRCDNTGPLGIETKHYYLMKKNISLNFFDAKNARFSHIMLATIHKQKWF